MNRSQAIFLGFAVTFCGAYYTRESWLPKFPDQPLSNTAYDTRAAFVKYENAVADAWLSVANDLPKTGVEITERTRPKVDAAHTQLKADIAEIAKRQLGDGTTEVQPIFTKSMFEEMAKGARR